jgi:Rrf2 family protein
LDITRGTLYAVYVLIFFYMRPRGHVADLHTISETLEVPESYLSKVMQQLHKGGFVVSVMGSKGGYRLSRGVAATTMRDVMHLIQGESLMQQCLLEQMLGELTIAQLAKEMGFTEEQQKVLDQISLGVQ